MKLFGSRHKRPGWLCLTVTGDRVSVSHVLTSGTARPEVLLCDSFRQEGDVVETLTKLKRELDLKRYRCMTLMPEAKYQLLQVEAPNVPAAETKAAVRWKVKELIDYPVESAAIDCISIPQGDASTGRPPQMFAVAAPTAQVADVIRPFQEAEIPLEVVDIPELAQRNVARYYEEPGRGVAFVVFDERGGLLTFTCDGELYQFRRLETSVKQFEVADDEQRQQLYDRITLELQRSLDNFDRQYQYVPIAKVVIAPVPGGEGLKDYLADNLGVPVILVDLEQILDFPRIPELRDVDYQRSCIHLIGGALRDAGGAP